LILTAFAGHTQNKKDTTCISNEDLKRKLIQLEQCKVDQAELLQKRNEALQLKEIIISKDSVISGLHQSLIVYKDLITNYSEQVDNLKKQTDLEQAGIQLLNKQLKKQKAKTILTAVAGLLLSGSLTYLFIHH
jgi:hypothetical protein